MLSQLTSSGYTVDVTSNGKEALQKYSWGKYDLVLTDIEMLEMNGYELTREISRLEAEAAHLTRIVAPTGSHFDLSANIST